MIKVCHFSAEEINYKVASSPAGLGPYSESSCSEVQLMVSMLTVGLSIFFSSDIFCGEFLSSGMPVWASSSEPTAGENVIIQF